MPLDTFHNLPPEKRERIIEAAVAEFAARGYARASMQSVAGQAGVAKGSLYQYFAHKQGLFLHLFELATDLQIAPLVELIQGRCNRPLLELLEQLFLNGIDFAAGNPALYRICREAREGLPPAIRALIDEQTRAAGQRCRTLLECSAARGELRADIDLDMAAFIVCTLLRHCTELGSEHGGIRFSRRMRKKYAWQLASVVRRGLLRVHSGGGPRCHKRLNMNGGW